MQPGPMKTEPWAHQLEDYLASRDLPGAAIPWPPRVGKTKLAIDTVAYHADAARVDAAIVIAPNGVHLNWTRSELPLHWPLDPPAVVEWESSKAKGAAFQRNLERALVAPNFLWVAVNTEALSTVNAKNPNALAKFLSKLVKRRRVFLICDEAVDLANPQAKRTRAVVRLRKFCAYARVLDGTMAGRGPFGLYSQYEIAEPGFFDYCGGLWSTFKARYGVFRRQQYGAGKAFDELVDYQRLDELNARIAPITFPRKKEECLDLPPRVFSRSHFVLSREYRELYERVKRDLVAEIDGGARITASMALTNLLRLQQISRGHVTTDDGDVRYLDGANAAVEATVRLITANEGKAIVWCRFVPDVELVCAALKEARYPYVRCDGTVAQRDRPALKDQFNNDPGPGAWVGTAGTGGRGIDLPAANLMVNHSHGFDYVQREQALERNYSSNQRAARCDVVDLVAADTGDLRALERLAYRQDLASKLDGRMLKEILA